MVVSHQINPSLQRLLALAGADVERWFRDMEKPRERAAKRGDGAENLKTAGQLTLSQYFLSQHCAVCDELTQRKGLHGRRFYSLCDDCEQDPQVCGVPPTPRLSLLSVPCASSVRCAGCDGDRMFPPVLRKAMPRRVPALHLESSSGGRRRRRWCYKRGTRGWRRSDSICWRSVCSAAAEGRRAGSRAAWRAPRATRWTAPSSSSSASWTGSSPSPQGRRPNACAHWKTDGESRPG